MNIFRVRGYDDATILGLSDVVAQCLGHHIQRQSPLSQSLDEFQPGHVFLPFRADLSECFAARAICHCVVLHSEDDQILYFWPEFPPADCFFNRRPLALSDLSSPRSGAPPPALFAPR